MEQVRLSSSLTMSRIALGFWRLMDWKMSLPNLDQFVKEAIALGVTTFDHAAIYGDYACEAEFGKLLKTNPKIRQQIQLVTKCGIQLASSKFPDRRTNIYNTSFDHIIESAEQSLANLNTDYIDLLLIHRPDPLMNPVEIALAFEKLEKDGKVLNFGVSNFNPLQYLGLSKHFNDKLVTNQIEYSPVILEHFDNGNMDFFMNEQIHPMGWSPLAFGQLFNPKDKKSSRIAVKLHEIAEELNISFDTLIYAWILYHPAKVIPIVGSGKIDRLKKAVDALDVKITREQWYEIYNASRGCQLP